MRTTSFRSVAAGPARPGAARLVLKAAAWVLAVPALCALVVLGGAAPIYLLLPAAEPAAVSHGAAPEASAPEASVAEKNREHADAPVAAEQVAALPPAETVAEAPETAGIAPPPEEMPSPEASEPAITVVPTARPVREVAAAAEPAEEPGTRPAAAAAARRDAPVAVAVAPKAEEPQRPATRRYVTIRPVALRSGPGGREVAMLGRGAEVLAGRCEDWCEVNSGGVRGWIHPSFLTAAGRRDRAPRRAADDRNEMPAVRNLPRRGERGRSADWFVDDDRPIEIYGYDEQ